MPLQGLDGKCVNDLLAMWPVTGSGRESLRRAQGDHNTETDFEQKGRAAFGDETSAL